MSEFLQNMSKLADELELRARNVREAAALHDTENSDESRSALRLAIAFVKPVTKAMKYTLKTSNVEVTGGAPIGAASGGPRGYTFFPDRNPNTRVMIGVAYFQYSAEADD